MRELGRAAWRVLAFSAALLLSVSPATAQRQRLLPLEPSRSLLIDQARLSEMADAISAYEAIVARGGWAAIPGRRALRLGDDDERVAILRARLLATGDLRARGRRATAFDQTVADAVRSFQVRHGLEPNGIVYGITLRSLNVSAEERLAQLRDNLDRMRELLPRLNAPSYLIMNSASFELQAVEHGRVVMASRTIVGKRQTPTPTISATVRAVNLLPYWHVPASIAQAALVPMARKDPGYLYRERIRVFSSFGGSELEPSQINWWGPETKRLVFRQDPGPQNALGLVRLDMPNKQIVYMHDTPLKSLFDYFERAFSAGCVRVQSVFDIAGWLLEGQGWSPDRLRQAALSGRPETIRITRPVPVHFVYLTAWTEGAVVQFRNDLYNRDDADQTAPRVSQPTIAP